jgi:hypothetical protein
MGEKYCEQNKGQIQFERKTMSKKMCLFKKNSIKLYNRLPGKRSKGVDDVAYYNWRVSKESVKECDHSTTHKTIEPNLQQNQYHNTKFNPTTQQLVSKDYSDLTFTLLYASWEY